MNPLAPRSEELLEAQFVLGLSEVTHPAYPDPSTPTGWADVPAALLLLDLVGREDIVYYAMMETSSLAADGGALQTSDPDDTGTCVYLLTADFGNEVDLLRIAGVAPQEAIGIFSRAEILLLSDDTRTTEDNTAPIFAIMPNDPIRWSFMLRPASPDSARPLDGAPHSPVADHPTWNAHRRSWLVRDPASALWLEHRADGWHALDALSDAS